MNAAGEDPKKVFLVATKAVVLNTQGNMLTMLRGASAPTNPLGWDLPGGILDHGEEIEAGVVRETKEETGLDIERPRVFHAIARPNALGEHWTTVYFVAYTSEDNVLLSWEHDEYKWIDPETYLHLQASTRAKEAVAYFIQLKKENKL